MIFTIALRNVYRNRKRNILTITGIAAGIVSIIILGGYYAFNYWGLRESFIRGQYAHIQITPKEFRTTQEQNPFLHLIPNLSELVLFLESFPEVEVVSYRLQYFGILDTLEGKSELVMIKGIEPERENQINTFFTKKMGKDLVSKDLEFAELGNTLAQNLSLSIGDSFTLSAITSDGFHNALPLKVKGIIGSYSKEYDSKIMRIPLAAAELLADVQGVQELVVLLKDTDKTNQFKKMLTKSFLEKGWELELTSWDEQAGYYSQVVQFYGGYFRIMLFIVFIVVFFSTLNTMIMSIFERIAEVGTVRSFGAKQSHILAQFLIEGLIIGLIGTAGGITLSFLCAGFIHILGGIPMPPPPGLTTQVAVYIRITSQHIILASAMGIGVPIIASFIPALHIVRTEIIDQIRSGY